MSATAQPGLATKASRWLLMAFVVCTLLALYWAAFWSLGLINSNSTAYFIENFALNGVVWLASLALLLLQAAALAGLYTRQHWAGPLPLWPRASGFGSLRSSEFP